MEQSLAIEHKSWSFILTSSWSTCNLRLHQTLLHATNITATKLQAIVCNLHCNLWASNVDLRNGFLTATDNCIVWRHKSCSKN